jgi:hypothetical protein
MRHPNRDPPMFLFQFLLKTVLLGFLTKVLGRFLPLVLRAFRLIFR